MAKADWTIITEGGWAVETDEAQSPTHSNNASAGLSRFLYAGDTSLLNSRVVASMKNVSLIGTVSYPKGMVLFGRCTNWALVTGFPIPPWNFYAASIHVYNTNLLGVGIWRMNAGVYSILYGPYTTWTLPVPGSGFTAWHKLRFSVTEEFSQSVLRVDYWNTTGTPAWNQIWEYNDASAQRLTAAGAAGFGMNVGSNNNSLYVDDVSVFELT